ncbi:mechanosensitive ion channel domain-containing protein [Terrarubrum flagellatum]|uniref:mechanosensitive ion channel domain-containing protein n=1 Tax=Terrirubrum flagellatum TaxID=2895980 RepID=UPI0031452320
MSTMKHLTLIVGATLAASSAHAADAGMTMGVLAHSKARIASFIADFAMARREFDALGASASSALMSGDGVRAATYLLILLMIGCGAEWYYWTFAYPPLRAIEASPVASPRQAAILAVRRFWIVVFALVIFTVATIGASAAFTWPPGVHEIVVTATLIIVAIRAALVVTFTLVSPRPPSLRLIAMSTRKAAWIMIIVGALAAIAATGSLVSDLLERTFSAPHAASALRLFAVTLAAAILLIAAAIGLRGRKTAFQSGHKRRIPAFPKHFLAAFLVLATYVLWIVAGAKAAAIVAIVLTVIACQIALRPFIFSFWKDRIEATPDQPAATSDAIDPTIIAGGALALARLIVVLVGLAACAIALDLPLEALAMSDIPIVRFGFKLLEVLALVLLTNVAWVAIRTRIDHRLKQIGPLASLDEPGPNARLLTLLPILRMTAAVVLAVLLVLSALWAIGVEITPLLAGAGVLGIAVGFGAQALVRDVISGFFYLAEDVFRVGEYIESGSSTKGTVERITLRTVALRHHNGPLHFVPYGSLGTVRNNSRDWVVEKFNLPLPISVDSEQIRKLIKKVGEEMMEDPEIGPQMREPLKGKIYRIDPGVKIFRCKFETTPGKQFDVRAAAFKLIEQRLRDAGIRFAESAQTVVLQQSSSFAGMIDEKPREAAPPASAAIA